MPYSKPEEKKNWPGIDDKCMNMTQKQQSPRRFIFFAVAEAVLKGSRCGFPRWRQFSSFPGNLFPRRGFPRWQQMWFSKKLTTRVTALERTENKVTPRRGYYEQCDPQTIISLKGFFFLLTTLGCGLDDSYELERRMRRIASLF